MLYFAGWRAVLLALNMQQTAQQALERQQQVFIPRELTEEEKELIEKNRKFNEERKNVELELATVTRHESLAKTEKAELDVAGKEFDEKLSALRERVASVTSELSQNKLNISLMEELRQAKAADDAFGEEVDPNLEVTTFRQVFSTIDTVFHKTLKERLRNSQFVQSVEERNTVAKAEYCHVIWNPPGSEEESADWKVYDQRDGTAVTFRSLLQDVCRYWGLDHEEMVFTDANGHIWPLGENVWDELGPTGDVTVYITRLESKSLEDIEYHYEVDETTLPLAVRRRLDRERKAKQLERHTKESIRKAKERERAAAIRELIKYLCMMTFMFLMTNERRSVPDAYTLTDAVRTQFIEEDFGDANEKTFMDIATYEEMYMWARDVFTDGLLPAEYYDGTEIPPDKKRVTYYNRVVGGVRMRQLRVTPNAGCTIKANVITSFIPTTGPDMGQERVRKYVDKCYSDYLKGFGDTGEGGTWSRRSFSVMAQQFTNQTGPPHCRDFANTDYSDARIVTGDLRYDKYEICLGLSKYRQWELIDPETGETNVTDPLKLAFTWRDAKSNDLDGYAFQGRFASYDGSGFVYDLTNLTTNNLVDAFNYLEENTWLDRQTRAFFISLMVYNANFNLYAVVNFRFELTRAGNLIPSYSINTVQMDLFKNFFDTAENMISLVLDGLLYTGMLYYLLNEFRELYSIYTATGSVKGYFEDFWNVIDWALIFLSYFALSQRIAFALLPEVTSFSPFAEQYVELTSAAAQYNNSFAFDAIALSFGIMKIFRYFELQRNLHILRESIGRGVADLSSFTFLLLLMILGFSLMGMNILGQENSEYMTPFSAFIALFMMVLGEFELEEILRVDIIFGYSFFFFYQVLIFLVMVNIFLAILNDAYIAVKMKFDAEGVEEGPPPPTMKERIQMLRSWLRQRKLDRRIEHLRAKQRHKELIEKREQHKVEEMRLRTLREMGAATDKTQGRNQGITLEDIE